MGKWGGKNPTYTGPMTTFTTGWGLDKKSAAHLARRKNGGVSFSTEKNPHQGLEPEN